jgi:hypothetical protein
MLFQSEYSETNLFYCLYVVLCIVSEKVKHNLGKDETMVCIFLIDNKITIFLRNKTLIQHLMKN